MEFRSSITGLVAFFLVVGVVSASTLGFYGTVKGTADVKGPILYAAPDNTLLINEEPKNHATYGITDGNSELFWTGENLGGIDFDYKPKADLYVRAKVNNATPSKPLTLEFGYSDTSSITHEICSSEVSITSTDLENYHTTCSGSSTLSNVNEFYYKIEGMGDSSIEYGVSTKNTKIEVNKG